MESSRRLALVMLLSALSACALGNEGDAVDGGSTPIDSGEQDAAVDDQMSVDVQAPSDDAPLDPVDVSATPDVAEDASAPLDTSAPDASTPDVPTSLDTGSSELDTGALDVAVTDTPVRDVPGLDLPRIDAISLDTPITRDTGTDAPTDAPTDTPTDAPTDGGCAAGSTLCSGVCLNHRATTAVCTTGANLGSFCGDTSCGTLCPGTSSRVVVTRTGTTSQWFRARAVECSLCGANTTARVNLSVPTGIDYDLFVYRPCGSLSGSSVHLAGVADSVSVTESESALSDDTFDYYIEVRYVSGSSCVPWTLTVEARSNNGSSC